jgi:hypothetical protein
MALLLLYRFLARQTQTITCMRQPLVVVKDHPYLGRPVVMTSCSLSRTQRGMAVASYHTWSHKPSH